MGTIVYPTGCGPYRKRPICLYSYTVFKYANPWLFNRMFTSPRGQDRFRMRRFIGQDNEEVLDLSEKA